MIILVDREWTLPGGTPTFYLAVEEKTTTFTTNNSQGRKWILSPKETNFSNPAEYFIFESSKSVVWIPLHLSCTQRQSPTIPTSYARTITQLQWQRFVCVQKAFEKLLLIFCVAWIRSTVASWGRVDVQDSGCLWYITTSH